MCEVWGVNRHFLVDSHVAPCMYRVVCSVAPFLSALPVPPSSPEFHGTRRTPCSSPSAGCSNRRPPPTNDRRKHRARLGVEALEGRDVPAVIFSDTYTWNGATVAVTVDDN